MTRKYTPNPKRKWVDENRRFLPKAKVHVQISRGGAEIVSNLRESTERSRIEVALETNTVPRIGAPNISENRYLKAITDLQNAVHPNKFVHQYCGVCSRMSKSLVYTPLNDIPKNLFLFENAPTALQTADPPTTLSTEGLRFLLFRIYKDRKDDYCKICDECCEAIYQDEIPTFSIPNYCFPESSSQYFEDLSIAETLMISKVYPRTVIYQHRAFQKGGHSYMKGHCVSFENDICNAVTVLPRTNDDLDGILRIVFIGMCNIDPRIPKVNTVNGNRVIACLRWLKKNHSGYKDITISEALSDPVYTSSIERIETMEQLKERVPQHHTFEIEEEELRWRNENGVPFEYFSTSGKFRAAGDDESITSLTIKAAQNTWLKYSNQGLLAIGHGGPMMDVYGDLSWLVDMYPTLFPRGLTGPTSSLRSKQVNFNDWVKYTLTIEDKRFREHHDYMFSMYNIIQRRAVSQFTRYKIRGHSFCGVTPDMLRESLSERKNEGKISNPAVNELLRKVQRVGAAIEHSPFRKTVLRQQIFGTITEKGWPTFFMTINPSDFRSPILKLSKLATCEREKIMNLLYQTEPIDVADLNDWTKFQYPKTFPSAVDCSIYFHGLIRSIIKVVCGYDWESKTYTEGLLGKVLAHFGVIEEQQRKTLHIHMLVWVEGFTNYDQFHNLMMNDEYCGAVLRYLNLLISEGGEYYNDMFAPSRGIDQLLLPPLQSNPLWKEVFQNHHLKVERGVQQHTCMKLHCLKRSNVCRYRFPKELVNELHYNSKLKRVQHKRVQKDINANMPLISAVIRCNNDIQFLPGNGKPKICRYIAYYISNYTSKTSTQTTDLLSFMVGKLSSFEKYSPEMLENERKLFDSLLLKTLNMFVAGNEIGGPEVASTLIGYPDHYTGESFTPIDWKSWDRWVCFHTQEFYHHHQYMTLQTKVNDPLNEILRNQLAPDMCNPSQDLQTTFTSRDPKCDYLFRPDSLEDICLYSFSKKYQFTSGSNNENVILFRDTHPLHFSCADTGLKTGIFERTKESIITLPWFNTTSSIHGVGTENFARIMMFLFKPFRCATELIDGYQTFSESFKAFKLGKDIRISPFNYMYNLEYSATASKEAQTKDIRSLVSLPPEHFDEELVELHDDRWVSVAAHLPERIVEEERPKCLTIHAADTIKEILRNQNALALEETQIPKLYSLVPITADSNSSFLSLDDSIENLFVAFVRQQQSKACNVQWNCIKLVAKYLLSCYRKVATEPVRVMLHGEGGTGKSYIIDVISEMIQILKTPNWLVKCAYTGKASINIQGDTIDGVFGFSRHDKSKSNHLSPKLLEEAKFLIVDECSMLGKAKLGSMHLTLGVNSTELDHIMGGRSFLLAGDFLQFSPIGDTSLISPLSRSNIMQIGEVVFKSIQYYFELTEQKRQNDIPYLQLLRKIRNREVDEADVQYLRDYCSLPPLETFDLESLLKIPIVVSQNELRYNWNQRFTKLFSQHTGEPIIHVTAIDSTDCVPNPLILAVLKQIMPDYLQHTLHLVEGMPVMIISRNLFKKLGVVNGGTGKLTGILCDAGGTIVALQVYIPPVGKGANWVIEGLPENTVLIQRVQTTRNVPLSDGTIFKLRRHQFPITEAFSITDYKAQGQTFSSAILSLRNGKGVSTYIKLSRTKNAATTYVCDDFELGDLQISYPTGYQEWRTNYLVPGIVRTMNHTGNILDFQ